MTLLKGVKARLVFSYYMSNFGISPRGIKKLIYLLFQHSLTTKEMMIVEHSNFMQGIYSLSTFHEFIKYGIG